MVSQGERRVIVIHMRLLGVEGAVTILGVEGAAAALDHQRQLATSTRHHATGAGLRSHHSNIWGSRTASIPQLTEKAACTRKRMSTRRLVTDDMVIEPRGHRNVTTTSQMPWGRRTKYQSVVGEPADSTSVRAE